MIPRFGHPTSEVPKPASNWRTNIFHNTNSKFNMKRWTEGTLFLVDDGALSLQRSAE